MLLNASASHAFEVEFQLRRVVVVADGPRPTRWQRVFLTHLKADPGSWSGSLAVHPPGASVRATAIASKIAWAAEGVLESRSGGESRHAHNVGFRCRVVVTYRGGARRETYIDTYTVIGHVAATGVLDATPRPHAFHPYIVMMHGRRTWPDWLSPRRSWMHLRYRG